MLRTDHSQIAYLQYLPVKKVGRLKPNGGEGGGGGGGGGERESLNLQGLCRPGSLGIGVEWSSTGRET